MYILILHSCDVFIRLTDIMFWLELLVDIGFIYLWILRGNSFDGLVKAAVSSLSDTVKGYVIQQFQEKFNWYRLSVR